MNRSDQDSPPSVKLSCETKEDLEWMAKNFGSKSKREATEYLLDSSFCQREWLNINGEIVRNIQKDSSTLKSVAYSILNRNIDLCKEWYSQMDIDSLVPQTLSSSNVKEFFLNLIDSRMWNNGDQVNDDYYEYYLPLKEKNQYLYLGFNFQGETLRENGIGFGFWAYDMKNKIKEDLETNIPKKMEEKYIKKENGWIYGSFTLISFSEISLTSMFKDFHEWLSDFPNKKLARHGLDAFQESVKKEYRASIFDEK